MKTLNCRDAGFDCEGKLRAESEEQILSQAAEQAEQIRTLIKDEEE